MSLQTGRAIVGTADSPRSMHLPQVIDLEIRVPSLERVQHCERHQKAAMGECCRPTPPGHTTRPDDCDAAERDGNRFSPLRAQTVAAIGRQCAWRCAVRGAAIMSLWS